MVNTGQAIQKSDLDALAGMANSVLLPLVNAAVLANQWPLNNPFDFYDDSVANASVNGRGVHFANPQPNYAFGDNSMGANMIPSGAVYDGSGHYAVTVTPYSFYDYVPGTANDIGVVFTTAYDAIGNIDLAAMPTPAAVHANQRIQSCSATTATMIGTAGQPVKAGLKKNNRNWMRELNRIRWDFFLTLTAQVGSPALNQIVLANPAAVNSGPWCIGVNDPVTFPGGIDQGFLIGTLPLTLIAGSPFFEPIYNTVQFYFQKTNVPDTFAVSTGRLLETTFNNGTTSGSASFNISYAASYAGQWNCVFKIPFSGSAGAPPPVSIFTIADTSTVTVAWTTAAVTDGSDGQFYLVGTISQLIAVSSGSINFTATISGGYLFPGVSDSMHPVYNSANFRSVITYLSATAKVAANTICQANDGAYITAHDLPANSDFVLGGVKAPACWGISDATVKGVWVAKTLPTPGMNVFLDHDLPPLVANRSTTGFAPSPGQFTILPDYVDNLDSIYYVWGGPPNASSMRQWTLYDLGEAVVSVVVPPDSASPQTVTGYVGETPVNITFPPHYPNPGTTIQIDLGEHHFSIISQTIQPQPTPWPTLRDTDLVPFDYGNNGSEITATNSHQFAPANGTINDYPLDGFGFTIEPSVVGINIKLLSAGTAIGRGWLNEAITYGTPLPQALKIFVSATDTPDPNNPATYSFVTGKNSIAFPADVPKALWNQIMAGVGFTFVIQNSLLFLTNAALSMAGGGYLPGDVLPIAGGILFTGAKAAAITIKTVDGSGNPLTWTISNAGGYTSAPASSQTPTGGHGSGATFTLTFGTADVNYDVTVEMLYAAKPKRDFFPRCSEAQSYDLAGPWFDQPVADNNSGFGGRKKIPQNGYCIHKVRAWRLPNLNSDNRAITPASGNEIVITIGQYELQWDDSVKFIPMFKPDRVTPFTITIPAAGFDTGDVEVFWPVLGGNELVYQASEAVRFEAGVNWQPLFHSLQYNMAGGSPAAIAYPNCLDFYNDFNFTGQGNYPDTIVDTDLHHVRFPPTKDIYNDLIGCLLLLYTPDDGGL